MHGRCWCPTVHIAWSIPVPGLWATVLSALAAVINDNWMVLCYSSSNLILDSNIVDKASISEAGESVHEESCPRA
jgi:hypothetical protein